MTEPTKAVISVVLDAKETELLNFGKEKSGIKSNTDFVRFLITRYADEQK